MDNQILIVSGVCIFITAIFVYIYMNGKYELDIQALKDILNDKNSSISKLNDILSRRDKALNEAEDTIKQLKVKVKDEQKYSAGLRGDVEKIASLNTSHLVKIEKLEAQLKEYNLVDYYVKMVGMLTVDIAKNPMTTKEVFATFKHPTWAVPNNRTMVQVLKASGFVSKRTTINKVKATRWYCE